MASFRALSGPPGMPPIGGRLVIDGIESFNRAADTVVRRFADISRAAGKVAMAPLPDLGRTTAYSRLNLGAVTAYTRFPGIMGAVSAAIVGGTAALVGLGAQFEKTGRQAQVFGQTTEREMIGIKNAALSMSRTFTTSANNIGKAATNLGKAGAPVRDLSSSILKSTIVLEQASQGELSSAEAGDVLVQSITALGKSWSDSAQIADQYVGAVQNSTATFADFGTQLKQVLPISGLLRREFDETVTVLALLNQGGLRGSIAGTAFKNALIALADPTAEARELMIKYNLSLFDGEGKALSYLEIISRLVDAFGETAEGVSDAQKFFGATDIFNTRQILAALTLVKQGTGAYKDMLAAVRATSAEQIAIDLQKNVIDQFKLLFNQVIAAAYAVTGEFLPSITDALVNLNTNLRSQGIEPFRDFGKEIRNIITLQNEWAETALVNIIAGMILADTLSKRFVEAAKKGFEQDLPIALETFNKKWQTTRAEIDATIERLGQFTTTMPISMGFWDEVLGHGKNGLATAIDEAAASWNKFYPQFSKDLAAVGSIFPGVEIIHTFKEIIALIATTGNEIRILNDITRNVLIGGWMKYVETVQKSSKDVQQAYKDSAPKDEEISQPVKIIRKAWDDLGVGIRTGFGINLGAMLIDTRNWANDVNDLLQRVLGLALPGFKRSRAETENALQEQVEAIRTVFDTTDMPNSMGFRDELVRQNETGLTKIAETIKKGADTVGTVITGATENILTSIAAGYEGAMTVAGSLIQQGTDNLTNDAANAVAQARAMVASIKSIFQPGMPSSMGFWDEVLGKSGGSGPAIVRGPSTSSFPPASGGGGGAGAKEDIDKIAARIRQMLHDLPAMNMELAKFLAGIVSDFPERLGPIVQTLLGLRDNVGQLAIAKADLLSIDLQLMQVEENITDLELQSGTIEIAQARAMIAFDKQLLGLKQQLLDIDRQTWPIKDQIFEIDRRLSDLNRTNFAQRREQLIIEKESIGIKRQIRDLEERITDAVDRRQQLLSRRDEISAEKSVTGLQRQLTANEKALEEAWNKFDVPAILGLEGQKTEIEDALQAAQDKLTGIQDAQTEINRATELTTIGYELEKIALEEQLEPYTKKAQILSDIIEDQRLQNEITSTYLEEEKQRLELLLRPYDDQARAIRRIIDEIDFLRAAANLEFEERKIGIQAQILAEKARQNELEITRRAQGVLFGELVDGFIEALKESEIFTIEEALEVAKRLDMWDDQTAKLRETKIEYGFIRDAADAYKRSLDAIARSSPITVDIITRHIDVYGDGSSTAPSATASAAEARGGGGPNITNNSTVNYNVDAAYTNSQSPASVAMDMRAMVQMAGR